MKCSVIYSKSNGWKIKCQQIANSQNDVSLTFAIREFQ